MLQDVVRSKPWKLGILAGLAMALAVALPDGTEATSLNEVSRLTGSDTGEQDAFGISTAISGDTALVGATGGTAGGIFAGAAYVFRRDEGSQDIWDEVKILIASDAQDGDSFGWSVAVNGDTAVVGTRNSEAVYVFQRDQGGADNWGEVTKLTASDAQVGAFFGHSVALSADTAVVGAWFEDFPGFGGTNAGAAYAFQRNEGGVDSWGEVTKLTASDAWANDFFGGSVAVSGDTAVVGASSAGANHTGAAYVFDLLQPKGTGDVNCDGTVNSIDASLVLQFSAALLGTLPCAGGADVNDDARINSIDAALILQFVAGLVPGLPPPPPIGI